MRYKGRGGNTEREKEMKGEIRRQKTLKIKDNQLNNVLASCPNNPCSHASP